ncbi:MAG: S41 family peptidase [Anaerolineales bacterium]|nr:S41 family peptidase [Anaerolineales bacterium]
MKKSIWILIGIVAGLVLITSAFSAGAIVGNLLLPKSDLSWFSKPTQAASPHNIDGTAGADPSGELSSEELFIPFWETWDIIHDQYIDQPVDNTALMRGAISGMLDSLGDQHTSYMDPDQYMQANIPMDGEYEGIGAWVDTTSEFLTIISPMANSPAEAAGLLPGDQVIMINGEDMTGIDGSLVIRQVLGPAGSKVVLTIRREGELEPFDVTVIREKIIIPSIDSRMLDDNIGYVQILTFGADTQSELRKNLKSILDQNPVGIIVDLRNNGGGYLQTAVEVGSEFIADGVILYEDYGTDEGVEEYKSIRGGLATEIPLVLLVNEGSASASEIVAGAIQDHERGPLVGATTFGKGSVQNWIELTNNQGAVRVTIARWLTPDKRKIHEIGLTPKYLVEFTEEDFEADLDPQLDKAIEVLLQIVE